ncbi:MAG: hypothetical protein U0P81_03245 [Holophagaceae bacterium]
MNPSHPSFDDQLRGVLAPAAAPGALRASVLAARQPLGRRAAPWLAAAATLLLAAGGVWLGQRPRLSPGPARDVAGQALTNFLSVHTLDFQGAPPAAAGDCGSWCLQRTGFSAPLPSCTAPSEVEGGRACAVGRTPVGHYLLKGGRGLYVFARPFENCGGLPSPPLAVAAGLQARAWNENGRGYVMIETIGRDGR